MENFMEKDFIDLFELQSRLKEGVESLFPKRVWLKAEVSSVKSREGGHCWLELSQSDGKGIIARSSAVIWSSRYRFLSPYFESVTGSPIQVGMQLLVRVQVSYSQLYGFSLIIDDLDPEYSLGIKELERQKTISRLLKEGLMDLQKELSLPLLPYRLAVVSAEDAAGYRDFVKHIEENPYGFAVDITLFPALMQGSECPLSVIEALNNILDCEMDFDVVLILRGGGSRLDLACFDDYDLAAVIAQYPLPVLTAIGHDQDYHVCDMVAHSYLKTPTALADAIISMYEEEDSRLSSLVSRIRVASSGRILSEEAAVGLLQSRIRAGIMMKLAAMDASLSLLLSRILSADPRRILERGYVLATDADGLVLKSALDSHRGDRVALMFHDGRLDCYVEDVLDVKGESV